MLACQRLRFRGLALLSAPTSPRPITQEQTSLQGPRGTHLPKQNLRPRCDPRSPLEGSPCQQLLPVREEHAATSVPRCECGGTQLLKTEKAALPQYSLCQLQEGDI